MLQVLAEKVRAEVLLRAVTLAKPVYGGQVLESVVPVGAREIREFLTAIPA